jgi:general secretion pathway protein J
MSPQYDQPQSPDAGFTLIEVLITLALLGLLSVALFGGLRFGARATDRATAVIDHASQIALAYGFLQAHLDNAQPFPATADPQNRAIIFDGTPDQMDVITTAPSSLATGGFFRLHLVAANDGGQLRLIGHWESPPRRAGGALETALPDAVLLDHLSMLRFGYFGAADPDDPSDWHDSWQAARVLPKMIRLRLEFSDGWKSPDLIVAPRLAEAPNTNG